METRSFDPRMAEKISEEDLRDIQNAAAEILKKTVDICERHNIPYYLIEGTLLGAVRHEGFIPWDDDIDIAIPAGCLSSFSKIAGQELEPPLYFDAAFSAEERWSPDLTRICNSQIRIALLSGRVHDLWIDVFCLIGMPKNKILRAIHYFSIKVRKYLIRVCRPGIIDESFWLNQKPIRRLVIKTVKTLKVGKLFSYRKQMCKLEKSLLKYPFEDSEFLMTYPSAYGMADIFPKAYYGDGMKGRFEGSAVRLPVEYHKILTSLYGDYMRLPPDDERKPIHAAGIIHSEERDI